MWRCLLLHTHTHTAVPPTSKHIDPTSYMVTREEGQKGRGSLGKASDHLLNVQVGTIVCVCVCVCVCVRALVTPPCLAAGGLCG